jgi:hypothetical protein
MEHTHIENVFCEYYNRKRFLCQWLFSSDSGAISTYMVSQIGDGRQESLDMRIKVSSVMPYLFGAAREAHQTGVPVMRDIMLEFPNDPACDYLVERQGISKPWQLLLVGIESIASVEGGEAESSTQGALVTPTYETEYLKIWLPPQRVPVNS